MARKLTASAALKARMRKRRRRSSGRAAAAGGAPTGRRGAAPTSDRRRSARAPDRPARCCLSPKMTARTAATDMRGAEQVQPTGVRVSVLGQHARSEHEQRDHHRQRQQEDRAPPEELEHDPPRTGPMALPAEKAPIQTPMAIERCFGSWNMWKISDSVEGASVAPAMPSSARGSRSASPRWSRTRPAARRRRRPRRRPAAAGAGRCGRRACPW